MNSSSVMSGRLRKKQICLNTVRSPSPLSGLRPVAPFDSTMNHTQIIIVVHLYSADRAKTASRCVSRHSRLLCCWPRLTRPVRRASGVETQDLRLEKIARQAGIEKQSEGADQSCSKRSEERRVG